VRGHVHNIAASKKVDLSSVKKYVTVVKGIFGNNFVFWCVGLIEEMNHE